jgi:sec-independent protein translocase protein TatA
MFDIGLPELIIILVILLLLFGAKRLPKLSHSIGESARELREGLTGEKKQAKTKPKTRGTGEGPTDA